VVRTVHHGADCVRYRIFRPDVAGDQRYVAYLLGRNSPSGPEDNIACLGQRLAAVENAEVLLKG
jgi:hypothetical protein